MSGRSYIFLDQLSSRGFVTFDGASGGVRLLLVVLSPLKSVFTRVRLHLGADTTPHLEHVHCHYTKIKGNSSTDRSVLHGYVLSKWSVNVESVFSQLLEVRRQEGSVKCIFQGLTFCVVPQGIESSIPSSRRILQTLHLRSRLAEPLCPKPVLSGLTFS